MELEDKIDLTLGISKDITISNRIDCFHAEVVQKDFEVADVFFVTSDENDIDDSYVENIIMKFDDMNNTYFFDVNDIAVTSSTLSISEELSILDIDELAAFISEPPWKKIILFGIAEDSFLLTTKEEIGSLSKYLPKQSPIYIATPSYTPKVMIDMGGADVTKQFS